jgi:hypothetical protein
MSDPISDTPGPPAAVMVDSRRLGRKIRDR